MSLRLKASIKTVDGDFNLMGFGKEGTSGGKKGMDGECPQEHHKGDGLGWGGGGVAARVHMELEEQEDLRRWVPVPPADTLISAPPTDLLHSALRVSPFKSKLLQWERKWVSVGPALRRAES